MQALLQLDDYWIDELALKEGTVSAPFSNAAALPSLDFEVLTAPQDDASESERFVVRLTVSASRAKVRLGIPYEFRVKLSGIFSFLPEADAPTKAQFLYYNAPAMLYGIARGVIGELTASGRQKRYVLPSLNFQEVYKQWKRRAERAHGRMAT